MFSSLTAVALLVAGRWRRARRRGGAPPATRTAPLRAASPRDPVTVGRQRVEGAAILDIADWLAAHGFADMERGELQRYAAWLRLVRAAHEPARATTP